MDTETICGNCGETMESHSSFCGKCGVKQEQSSPIEDKEEKVEKVEQVNQVQDEIGEKVAQGEAPVNQGGNDIAPPQKNNKQNLLIGVGLLNCILLVGVLVIFGGKDQEVAEQKTESLQPPVTVTPPSDEISQEVVESGEEVTEDDVLLEELEDLETLEDLDSDREETLLPSEFLYLKEPEPEVATGIDMINVEQKRIDPSHATASSVYPTWQHITYGPELTYDGNTDTAWVENAQGIGVGEWVEQHFASPEVVGEIRFYNGYGSAYAKNGVSSKVKITLSGGQSYEYQVVGHWNTLVLPECVETSSVRLTILEAYSSQDQDTCISEIMVYNKSYEAPTLQLGESAGLVGDISGVTSSHAAALLSKVEEYEGQYGQNVGGLLFDGGYNIPVLLLYFSEKYGDIDSYQTEIWEWDGEQLVEPYWNSETKTSNMYVSGVSKKNGQYYATLSPQVGGSADGMYPYLQVSYVEGRMGVIATADIYYYCYQSPEYIDSELLGMSTDPLLKRLDQGDLRDRLLETEFEVNYTFGSFQNFQRVSSGTIGDWDASFSGNWANGSQLKALVQEYIKDEWTS